MDGGSALSLLTPYVVDRDSRHGFVRIRANDGGQAGVYMSPDSFVVNRFSSGGILDIVADVVIQLRAMVLLPEGVAILTTEEDRPHLPAELRNAAVVADLSGATLQGVIDSL
jgi:hypothetical protein